MNNTSQKKSRPVIIGVLALVLLVGAFLLGLNAGSDLCLTEQAKGFRLPTGDDEAGKVAFTELGCLACHSVSESEIYPMPEHPAAWHVVLGGDVTMVKTYGELVTAIIHPSESIRPDVRATLVDEQGRSVMPDLTRQMTTRQMIDLVTYLQHQYQVVLPDFPSNTYPYGIELVP